MFTMAALKSWCDVSNLAQQLEGGAVILQLSLHGTVSVQKEKERGLIDGTRPSSVPQSSS